MGSKTTTRTERVLALIIFPTITAAALKLILRNMGFFDLYVRGGTCKPGMPLTLPYTGFPPLDQLCCWVVSFMHSCMAPLTLPFLNYFLYTIMPTTTLMMFVEANRPKRPAVVGFPTIVGGIYMVCAFGVTMPVYWLLFILSGTHRRERGDPGVIVSNAQAWAFGVAIIFFQVVSYAYMVHSANPYVTALWLLFPYYIPVAKRLVLIFRPENNHLQSGYGVVKALYILFAIGSSVVHIYYILPLYLKGGISAALSFFTPTASLLPNASLPALSLDSLQWDLGFGVLAPVLATLFFARNLKELSGLIRACVLE